jgi:hypothetical protein
MQKSWQALPAQVFETIMSYKRHGNCYNLSASDVPAAGETSGQPNEKQTPGKSIRKKGGPEKGNDRSEKSAVGAVGKPPSTT